MATVQMAQQKQQQPQDAVTTTSKVYLVPIGKMMVPTAGVCQREFNQAWGNYLAKNFRLEELGIPVVNLRDGVFWIIDGQHRIYGLKENGFADYKVECEVYKDLSDEEMAAIFDGRNTRKSVSTFDQFLVRCTRGNKREAAVRRIVEANGLKIARSSGEGNVSCVAALGKVYDQAGEVILGMVLRMCKESYGNHSSSFDHALVVGLAMVVSRYGTKVSEESLAKSLGGTSKGVRGLLQLAEVTRARTGQGKAQCVAAVVVDLFNKGRAPARRLPTWWKTDVVAKG